MPSITGAVIVNDAFAILNVFLPGESVPDNDGQLGLRFLNDFLSEQSQKTMMIPVVAREVFDMTADKGGPSNPYTIGSGGNLNTTKPANQNSITRASLLLTSSDPDVEVPLTLFTDDSYEAIQVKELSSSQPTGLYYNPTYATSDLGTINIWPVPDIATNDLVLYIQKPLAQFADLSTTYYMPAGVPRMLKYNLADALQEPYGKQMKARAQAIAQNTLGTFKRSNTKLFDLTNDASFNDGIKGIFNIDTFANG